MKSVLVLCALGLLLVLLTGCTQTTGNFLPYTTSQYIAQSTDLNYTLFQQGVYDGNCLKMDGNKITVSSCLEVDANIPWDQLIDFPVGCGVNQAVKIVGSSLVCVDLPTDTNFETAGYDFGDYVPYTGAISDVNLGLHNLIVDGSIYSKDPVADVRSFGATGDGVTDDTIAIQTALNASTNVYFPTGTYIVSNLTITNDTTHIFGNGDSSIIKFKIGATGSMIDAGTNKIFIEKLRLTGGVNTSYKTNGISTITNDRNGLELSSSKNSFVINITIDGFENTGLLINDSTTTVIDERFIVDGIVVKECFVGVETGYDGENYTRYTNLYLIQNRFAFKAGQGSVNLNNSVISKNYYGIYLDGSRLNNGHSNANNNLLNHNINPIYAENISIGYNFLGNQIFEGTISLIDSTGVRITNGTIDVDEFYLSGGGINYIENNHARTRYDNNITHVGDETTFINNYLDNGTFLENRSSNNIFIDNDDVEIEAFENGVRLFEIDSYSADFNIPVWARSQGIGTSSLRAYSDVGSNMLFFVNHGSSNQGELYLRDGSNANKIQLDADGYSWLLGGNVGIGTTSPSLLFHVYHPTTNGVSLFESGDSTVFFNLKDNATTGNGYAISRTGDDLKFFTADTGRMQITSTGDVRLYSDNQKLYFGAGDDASITYDGTDMLFTQEVGSGDFVFTGGNVGIGTTAPEAPVDIRKVNVIPTYSTEGILNIASTNEQNIDLGASITLGGTVTTGNTANRIFASIEGRKSNATSGNTDGYLVIKTTSYNVLTERMRITSAGDIKIPADSKKLYFGAGDDASITYNGTNFIFNHDVGSGSFIFSGINNQSVWIDSRFNADLRIDRSDTRYQSVIRFETNGSPNWYTGLTDSDLIRTGNEYYIGTTNSTPKFLIDTSGHIYLPNDSVKLYFGAGDDASISYDGTNMLINPKEVGSGVLKIEGDLNIGTSIVLREDNNITMKSPDGTSWNCGVDNTGVFNCS